MVKIATIPRQRLRDYHGYVPWELVAKNYLDLFGDITWIERNIAEKSDTLCQAYTLRAYPVPIRKIRCSGENR